MMTDKEVIKRHSLTLSIGALITWIPLIPVFWFVIKPILIEAVSVAVAQDIQMQVKTEISPLNSAFKVLLQNQIDNLIRHEAVLKNKRQFDSINWTSDDATQLVNSQIEIRGLQKALEELG